MVFCRIVTWYSEHLSYINTERVNLFQYWFFKNEIWNIFLVVTGPRIGPRTGPQNRFQHQFLTNFINKFWQKTNSQLIENKIDRLERCVRDAEAGGSNPLTPTIFFVLYNPVFYGWIFLYLDFTQWMTGIYSTIFPKQRTNRERQNLWKSVCFA